MVTDILSVVPFIISIFGEAAFHFGQEDTREFYEGSVNASPLMKVLKMLFFLKIM